jgi:hypothetical protein
VLLASAALVDLEVYRLAAIRASRDNVHHTTAYTGALVHGVSC